MTFKNEYKTQKKTINNTSILFSYLIGNLGTFLLFYLISFGLMVGFLANSNDFYNIYAYIFEVRLSIGGEPSSKVMFLDNNMNPIAIDRNQIETSNIVSESLSHLKAVLIFSGCISLILGCLFTLIVNRLLSLGFGRDSKFIRGGVLVEPAEMAKTTKAIIARERKSDWNARKPGTPHLDIGGIKIPYSFERTHISISGDTGAMKSRQIKYIIDTLVERDAKAVIYDPAGEFTEEYFREGYDIMLNPFDNRCPHWSIFNESKSLIDFERAAQSFFPDTKDEKGQHWIEAGRLVFAWALYLLYKRSPNIPTSEDIIELFTAFDEEEVTDKNGNTKTIEVRRLEKHLQGTLAEPEINSKSPQHASDVLATIIPKIKAIYFLEELHDRPTFSIKDWVKDDSDRRRVFIRANQGEIGVIKPLITAWFDIYIQAMLSLNRSDDRESWLMVDEAQSLHRIQSLQDGIFQGRKHGLTVCLGYASLNRCGELYGEKAFKQMVSMCGINSIYRIKEPSAAKWSAEMLTEREVIEEMDSISISDNHNQTGSSEQRKSYKLATPSEIQLLNEGELYLVLKGDMPVTKLKLKYKHRPIVSEGFIQREAAFNTVKVKYDELSQDDANVIRRGNELTNERDPFVC